MASFRWRSGSSSRHTDANCQHQQHEDHQDQHQQDLSASTPPPSLSSDPSSVKVITKRTQVRDEIISSEETYIKELRTLVVVFLRPLEKWAAEGMGELGLPAGSVSEIFSNVEEILAFNERFLRELESSRRRGIGATFRRQPLDMFKPYSVYVKQYPQAVKTLAACEEFSEFKAFVRACEHQEACHGLDLRAYLIQPVQRVPRYRLLIIELLKHTKESHPDWVDLQAALENVSSTVAKLNEGARDQERFVRALELEYDFREHFLTPSSHLVKEGDLLKVCNGGPRRYKFVLFSDMLVYGTETNLRAKLQLDYRKYKVHRRIFLHECLVLDYGSSDSFVVARSNGKSFVAMAVSAEEKQAWLDAFSEGFAEIHSEQQQDDVGDTGNHRSRQEQQQEHEEPSGGDTNGDAVSSPNSEASSSGRVSDDDWTTSSPQEDGRAGGVDEGAGNDAESVSRAQETPQTEDTYIPRSPPPRLRPSLPTAKTFGFSSDRTLAQSVTASLLLPGRWSLPSAGGRLSMGSQATAGGGGSPRSARSSFSRPPRGPCVQVWVPMHGRTEMHAISLQGLPPGSKSGLFKVEQMDIRNGNFGDTNGDERPSSGPKKNLLASAFPSVLVLRTSSARSDLPSLPKSRSPSPPHFNGEGTEAGGTVVVAGEGEGVAADGGGLSAAGVADGVGGGGEDDSTRRGDDEDVEGNGSVGCGRGLAKESLRSTGLVGRVEGGREGGRGRRARAAASLQAAATMQVFSVSDHGEEDIGWDSVDPAEEQSQVMASKTRRKRTSWSLPRESGNVRMMLQKFEVRSAIRKDIGEHGGKVPTAAGTAKADTASTGRTTTTTAGETGANGRCLVESRGKQPTEATKQQQADEEKEGKHSHDSSTSSSTRSDSMLLDQGGGTTAVAPAARDAAAPCAGGKALARVSNRNNSSAAGDEASSSTGRVRPSQFHRQSRSWNSIRRRSPSPPKTGNSDDENNRSRSRSNSPPPTSSGVFGTLQRGFCERMSMNSNRRRSASNPPQGRKRWSTGEMDIGLAGYFFTRARGAAAADDRRKDGDNTAEQQQLTRLSDREDGEKTT